VDPPHRNERIGSCLVRNVVAYVWIRSVVPSHSANACHPEQLEGLNRSSGCKTLQPLLQNVWREGECRIDVCRATAEACFELVQGMKEVPA